LSAANHVPDERLVVLTTSSPVTNIFEDANGGTRSPVVRQQDPVQFFALAARLLRRPTARQLRSTSET
jgi:hypothetical protein